MDSMLVLDGDTHIENLRLVDGDPKTSKASTSSEEIKWIVY